MDNSAQWPQGFGGVVVKGVDNPSSSGSIDQQQQQQQKRTLARPQKDQIVNCPRCNSVNTKFCYYNNYSLSQPRYFCKTCRRYWTAGGSLRNVPVGGGSRKNRRSSSSSSSSVATNTSSVHSQASAVANNLHQGHDLNLSFPLHPTTTTTTTHDDHLHRHHQYPNPTFTTTSTKPNFSMDNHLSNTTKLLPYHLQNPNSTNMIPLLPPMGLFKNTLLAAHDHSSREMMSSLMNPPEHHHTSNSSNASIFSNTGFTQIHQGGGQFKPSSLNFSLDGFSNDNHNEGYAASCLQLGVQQQSSDDNAGGMRLLFPFNQQQENMNNKDQHQKRVPSASAAAAASSDVVRQFDHQHNMINRSSSAAAAAASVEGGNGGDHNGSSAGFWTGMLSGGSW